MDQERGGGEPIIVVTECARVLGAGAELGNEMLEGLEHAVLQMASIKWYAE
jgi:hypothetical protein